MAWPVTDPQADELVLLRRRLELQLGGAADFFSISEDGRALLGYRHWESDDTIIASVQIGGVRSKTMLLKLQPDFYADRHDIAHVVDDGSTLSVWVRSIGGHVGVTDPRLARAVRKRLKLGKPDRQAA